MNETLIWGHACRGCVHCEQGPRLIGVTTAHWALVLFTGGLWLIAPIFYKRCLHCGHSRYFNQH